MIDGQASVISVVVVSSAILGLQVVAAIEEFTNVSAASPLDDELATWVIRSVVGGINDEVVKQEQVSSAFASNGVELFLSHGSSRSNEVDVSSDEHLVADLHD